MKKIFIDGREGTTGLLVDKRVKTLKNVEEIVLLGDDRKDVSKRKEAINSADIVVLCLPDGASREAVSLCENKDTVIIDASTAHRTKPGWTYGMPELCDTQVEKIKSSKRIAIPGCHASGFIALVRPLVISKIISDRALLGCTSITGYSGGGKKMISDYEQENVPDILNAPRIYGLNQNHKHLPEMKMFSKLKTEPVFCPTVAPFFEGMLVTVPIHREMLTANKTIEDVKICLKNAYQNGNILFDESIGESGFVNSNEMKNTDKMKVAVFGNEDRMVLTALYDNLGKGASGALLQCLDIILED